MALFPVRDLIGPLIWALSYASNRIQWRGEVYELEDGGRMRSLSGNRLVRTQFKAAKANDW
jgi:ceramide glucosyltransferase